MAESWAARIEDARDRGGRKERVGGWMGLNSGLLEGKRISGALDNFFAAGE